MSTSSNLTKIIYLGTIVIGIFVVAIVVMNYLTSRDPSGISYEVTTNRAFANTGLQTDTSQTLIDLSLVLSGGPIKDGIPAINDPEFITISQADPWIDDEFRGLLFEHRGIKRFYPYNILVWHEIVNDQIDSLSFAVTFCPLCGSGIIYNSNVSGSSIKFGVSGRLYESNLLMYDDQTESLWSQIEGKALIGQYAGKTLEVLKSQLLTFAEVKQFHPETEILSQDTGYQRNYSYYPYGDYDINDDLYFPVTYKDRSLPLKEIMYAVSYKNIPVAFVWERLRTEGTASITLENGAELAANYADGNVIVLDPSDNEIPGYFTQWFSWANHNLPAGVNPNTRGEVWGM